MLWKALHQAGGGTALYRPLVFVFLMQGGTALYRPLRSVLLEYIAGGGVSTVPCVRFYIAEETALYCPLPVFAFI